jgi:uncharacterized protein (TIGR02466 family)
MFQVPFLQKKLDIDVNQIVNSIRDHAQSLENPNPWPHNSTVITSLADNTWADSDLLEKMKPVIEEYLTEWIGNNKALTQCHMWYNVYNNLFQQEQHGHSTVNSLASGVVFLQMPKGSTATTFINPMKALFDHCAYKQELSYYTPPVGPGTILIFPPWLEHRVQKQNIQNTRVTVAFNILNA